MNNNKKGGEFEGPRKTKWHLLVKINNRNSRKRCGICSKLTIKTPERSQRRRFVLDVLLLTLNIFHTLTSSVTIVDFEQVNASWAVFQMFLEKCDPENIEKFLLIIRNLL